MAYFIKINFKPKEIPVLISQIPLSMFATREFMFIEYFWPAIFLFATILMKIGLCWKALPKWGSLAPPAKRLKTFKGKYIFYENIFQNVIFPVFQEPTSLAWYNPRLCITKWGRAENSNGRWKDLDRF